MSHFETSNTSANVIKSPFILIRLSLRRISTGTRLAIINCKMGAYVSHNIRETLKTTIRLLLTSLLLVGCGQVAFDSTKSEKGTALKNPTPPTEPPPNEIVVTLKSLQPALAVRGLACLMCHADIRSNVITDFGYGNPWYLGENRTLDQGVNQSDQSWFSNLASTWQTARIKGSVFVPNVEVTRAAQDSLGSAYVNQPLMKLDKLMTTPYQVAWNFYEDPEVTFSDMALRVQPLDGNAKVIAKSQIVIRAPSEAEIFNLVPGLTPTEAGFKRANSAAAVEFVIKGSGVNAYTTNDSAQTLSCSKSDIIVNGTLFLKKLKVNAAGGCRLYVTGSVFIEDAIEYVGSGADQNLQITSANAIIMGINVSHLQNRLLNERRNLELSGTRDYLSRAQQAVQEAQNIGTLVDAQVGSDRTSIDFSGLLLNAPVIHSRYLGEVHGTVIAEAALFVLEDFHFQFDSVFTRVDVLPLLTNPVLVVK